MRWRARAWLTSLSLLLWIGCGDDDDDDGVGAVVAEWSIDGRTDRAVCDDLGADLFEVSFFDRDQVFAGEVEEPCDAFSVVIEADEGTYDINTRLITFRQEQVSEELFFEDVIVEDDVDAILHADFRSGTAP